MKRTLCIGLLLLFLMGVGYSQYRALFTQYNPFYGARAASLGNAFTALANDLSAVYWNPAGLTEITTPEVYVNLTRRGIFHDMGTQTSTTQSYTHQLDLDLSNFNFLSVSVPAVFWDIKWNFAVSYYRYLPYQWEGTGTELLIPNDATQTTSKMITTISGSSGIDVLAFSGAFCFSPSFSIGVTWQQFLNTGSSEYAYASATSETLNSWEEKLRGWNMIIGILYKPIESFHLGFAYQTRMSKAFEFTSENRFEDITNCQLTTDSCVCDIFIPDKITFGIMFQPFPFMKFLYDHVKINWAQGTITGYYGNSSSLPFPVRNDFTFSQMDVFNNRIGLELNYRYNRYAYFIRAGLFWDRQLFLGSDEGQASVNGFSLGFGLFIDPSINIDIGIMRRVSNWTEPGYFDSSNHIPTTYSNNVFSLSVSYHFIRPQ